MIFQPQLTIPQWLELPWEVRHHLVHLFSIPRSSGTETLDGRIMTDGYTHADLKHITVAKMQAYLDSHEEGFFALFNQVIKKVNREMYEADSVLVAKAEAEHARAEAAKAAERAAAVKVLAEAAGVVEPPKKRKRNAL